MEIAFLQFIAESSNLPSFSNATARLFANAGWDLFLVARDENSLQLLSNELSEGGRKVRYKAMDLSAPELISTSLNELLSEGVVPSVLINNAGLATGGPRNSPVFS